MISIRDFIPKYPNFENFEDEVLNPYDELFDKVIYSKKEFYDKKLDRYESKPLKPGDLLKHQEIVARYLSAKTLYDSLLLYHEMGTGKTGVSIALSELLKKQGGFGKTLVLMRGKALIDNYIQELAFVNTAGIYIPDNYENLKSDDLRYRRVRKKVGEFYEFDTFEVFAKDVAKMGDAEIIINYSNRLIIIDEVHNIRPGNSDGIDIYNNIHRVLHLVKNSKILLMSATPMKDRPQEIANIMNLILPLDDQLPTGEQFIKDFMISGGREDIYLLNPSKIDNLKRYIKGRVSYLKTQQSEVKRQFIGKGIGKLQKFKVYDSDMSDFQSTHYINSYRKDTESAEEKGIYSNSRQSSLFVFPDGSWGGDGFKKYVNERRLDESTVFELSSEFKMFLTSGGRDRESILNKISQCSVKYSKLIRILLDSYENGRLSFVYGDFVSGSGMVLLSKLLELVGFRKTTGGDSTQELRYSIITNKTTTTAQTRTIIKSFNEPKNANGKYVSVIIGSKVISEGFSLKNVQDIHIITPHWNYSETDQAIARGIRAFSHQDLINKGILPDIKIYQHVALSKNVGLDKSIDYKMYLISEDKDITIKSIERVVKESAFDCALNYIRNRVYGLDNLRACEYTTCEYKCSGDQQGKILSPGELDDITYNLYYSEDSINKTIDILKGIYLLKNKHKFEDLSKHVTENYILLKTLDYMIQDRIPLFNKHKQLCYLKQYGDIFYLDISVDTDTSLTQSNYLENIVFYKKPTVIDAVAQMELVNLPKSISVIESTGQYNQVFSKFTVYSQELFIEGSVLANIKNIDKNRDIREWVLKKYDKYIIELEDGGYVSLFLYDNGDKKVIRHLEKGSESWIDSTDKYKTLVESLRKTKDIKTSVGFYGVVENKTDKFLIVDVSDQTKVVGAKGLNKELDNRKKSRGRVCTTLNKTYLIKLCVKLGITPPEDEYKELNSKSLKYLVELSEDRKYSYITKVYDEDELNKLSKKDLVIALGFANLSFTNNKLCGVIKSWFENKNLLQNK